ncbi:hypothetical protein HYH03_011013 [Edaphochlamys debaryana]|uniref:EGF-like domain-containing protein n=1 Tax=Edaphochlamys debaryana TaxID=47281 RepID=A0A835XUZ8_9CHLO|nr:hypothetical protein HYH03_011013 [Edaphochlamys debaryana]|eukprot:KAG2490621.1 hypothetical protein HYH03_011013 [Edaphochlamys debaryana]
MACALASLFTSQAHTLCSGSVEPRCGLVATCVDTAGGYKCQCPRGFYFVNATKACVDVNECAYQPCKGTARCFNTNGSFSCVCPAGFSYNGTTCVDNNECAALISPCKGNSTCENTPGSYKCNCSKGYWYTGTGCADANECLQSWPGPCKEAGFCANTLSSYRCTCPNQPTKFYNDAVGDCRDPCVPNPCSPGICSPALNSAGRKYTCSCPSPSAWNATTGTCSPGVSLSGTNVAFGKPVTCSTNPAVCARAVDGSTSTLWTSLDSGFEICINVTLGTSPIQIIKVAVDCTAASDGHCPHPNEGRPREYHWRVCGFHEH